MRRFMFPVVATLFLLLAGSAVASRSAGSGRGVVVAPQHGVLLVASSRGVVRAVSGRARVGERVLVRGSRVVGVVGRARRAVIRGVVVRRSGRLTLLSAGRHLLVVHVQRAIAAAAGNSSAPGTIVQQTVGFDDQGDLDDQGEQDLGQTGQTQIRAQVTAVGPGTVTVTVNGQPLVIPLPAGLTLSNSVVGTQVTLNISFANGQATGEDDPGDQNDKGHGDQGDQNDQSDDNDQGDQGDHGDQSSTTTATTTGAGDDGGD
jgi:hypothetical protein